MNSSAVINELIDSLDPTEQADLLRCLIERKRKDAADTIPLYSGLLAATLRVAGFPTLADRIHCIAELATSPDVLDHNTEPKTIENPTPKHFRNAAAGTNDNRAAAWLMLAAKELEAARTPAGS